MIAVSGMGTPSNQFTFKSDITKFRYVAQPHSKCVA